MFDALSSEGPVLHNHFAPAGGSRSYGAGAKRRQLAGGSISARTSESPSSRSFLNKGSKRKGRGC